MMRSLWILPAVMLMGVVGMAQSAAADDWEDIARDNYFSNRKAVRQDYNRLDDELEYHEERAEDLLDARKRAALRHAHGRERVEVLRHFREQERLLDDVYDEQKDGLKHWYEQEKDRLKHHYDAERNTARYGHPHYSAHPAPGYPVPGVHAPGYVYPAQPSQGPLLIPAQPTQRVYPQPGPVAPLREGSRRTPWGFHIGPFSLNVR